MMKIIGAGVFVEKRVEYLYLVCDSNKKEKYFENEKAYFNRKYGDSYYGALLVNDPGHFCKKISKHNFSRTWTRDYRPEYGRYVNEKITVSGNVLRHKKFRCGILGVGGSKKTKITLVKKNDTWYRPPYQVVLWTGECMSLFNTNHGILVTSRNAMMIDGKCYMISNDLIKNIISLYPFLFGADDPRIVRYIANGGYTDNKIIKNIVDVTNEEEVDMLFRGLQYIGPMNFKTVLTTRDKLKDITIKFYAHNTKYTKKRKFYSM